MCCRNWSTKTARRLTRLACGLSHNVASQFAESCNGQTPPTQALRDQKATSCEPENRARCGCKYSCGAGG